MSLNWDGTKVKGWKDLPNWVRDSAIWLSMVVDMGAITEKNYREFALRADLYQRLNGSMFRKTLRGEEGKRVGSDPLILGLAEIKSLVGLRTNVSTRGRGVFLAKLGRIVEREMKEAEARAVEAKVEAQVEGVQS